MRRLSLFLLCATAAAPVLAAMDDDSGREARRAERRAAAAAADSDQTESQPQQERRAPRAERQPSSDQGFGSRMREIRGGDGGGDADAQQVQNSTNSAPSPRRAGRLRGVNQDTVTEGQQQAGGGLMPRQRRLRTIPDTQPTATAPTDTESTAFEGQRRDYRDGNYKRWSATSWRHDDRYNWRDYRNRNRSLFRLGIYYDPFGWNYRRFNIGWRLWPSHYGSRYWLNDPWQYRLPQTYGPYRWVRYWDDALLVNIYTGEVVDMIPNFFW